MQFIIAAAFIGLLAASGVCFYKRSFAFGYAFLALAFTPIAADALLGMLGVTLQWW